MHLTASDGAGARPLALEGGMEGIDQLENGALIGWGEVVDLPKPLEEAGRPGGLLLDDRLEAEQFVAGHLQGLRELDEEGPGGAAGFPSHSKPRPAGRRPRRRPIPLGSTRGPAATWRGAVRTLPPSWSSSTRSALPAARESPACSRPSLRGGVPQVSRADPNSPTNGGIQQRTLGH